MPEPRKGVCSIVIPTRNEGNLLHMTVDSILSETNYPSFEILIVDDGSTDNSCDRYRRNGDDGKVKVVTSEGLGVARARNLGAENASGDYLVFIDAHCKVSPGWIDRFIESFSAPDVGIVGPCFTRLNEPEPRGCGTTWIDYTLTISWFEPPDFNKPYEVPLLPGGCHAFTRDNFYRIGRYEEGFATWGYEDVEISLRTWLLGYRVLADPRITIAHHFRESRNFEVANVHVVYNFLRLVYMHFSQERIQRALQAVGPNEFLAEAHEALEQSDIFELRSEMEAVRVRDDDWFFKVFMPNLDSILLI
jgi:glycosyltransferase involved in cell wall biosynthesis